MAPPPPELIAPPIAKPMIPQRERVTFLVHLAGIFAGFTGLMTAFAMVGGYVVLNVIPMDRRYAAVTIGLRYRTGAWWFVYQPSGRPIRPANELSAAAHQIRTQIEKATAA